MAFNSSKAPRAVALDLLKVLDKGWHTGLLHLLKSYGISSQIFGLILSFLSNRWLRVILDEKSSQECPVIAGVPKGFILRLIPFLLYIVGRHYDVICNIVIYGDDTILYPKSDQTSDLWQQLQLVSELESDLWDTVPMDKKWLFALMLEKLSWFCLNCLITLVLLIWKWMSLFLRKNHFLRCWGCRPLSKLDCGS